MRARRGDEARREYTDNLMGAELTTADAAGGGVEARAGDEQAGSAYLSRLWGALAFAVMGELGHTVESQFTAETQRAQRGAEKDNISISS